MSEQESDFALSCIHDNPSTWRREVWLDGRKIATFCWTLFDRDDIARKTVPFYCPIAPFKPDQIWGDAKAMYPCKAPPSPGGWQRVRNLVAMHEAADSEPKGAGDES